MELEHEDSIPFFGTVITRCGNTLKQKCTENQLTRDFCFIFKATLLTVTKKSVVNTMVDRAYRLSSTEEAFTKECDKLRTMFSKLGYPNTLVNSTIHKFMQETDRVPHAVTFSEPSVYIKLPFEDELIVFAKKSILSDL